MWQIKIILLLLLTAKAYRIYNVSLTDSDLNLHANNFFLQAATVNCQKQKKCSWGTEKSKTEQSIVFTPSGLWLRLQQLLIVRPVMHIYSRCLLQFIFSLISSINAHHIILWLISPPYTWWEDKNEWQQDRRRAVLLMSFHNAFHMLLLKGATQNKIVWYPAREFSEKFGRVLVHNHFKCSKTGDLLSCKETWQLMDTVVAVSIKAVIS